MAEQSKRLTGSHWMVLIAAFSGWMFDGLEMGLFPVVARPALQDLMGVTDDSAVGAWNGYIVALFLLGAASGGFIFGWLGDRLGRVRTMMLSILTYSFFTGCCYFAQAPWHLGVFRFMAALGMGGEWALGVALVMECWPEKLRPLLAGVIGAAANVGFLLIAAVGWAIPVTVDSWRWMFLVGAVPALLTIFIRIFVPESQRWKESVREKASQPVREIFSPALLRPTILAICFASIALIGTWGAVSGFLPVWTDKLAGGQAELVITAAVAEPSAAPIDESVDAAGLADTTAEGPVYVVRKTHDFREVPGPGEQFSYHLTLANTGRRDGTAVQLTDYLPIKAIDPQSVTTDDPGNVRFSPEDGKLQWAVGTLPAQDPPAKATLKITMKVAERPRAGIDSSTVRCLVSDDGSGGPAAVYAVRKVHDLGAAPQPGQEFMYTLTVANKAERTATRLKLTDRLPVEAIDPSSVETNDPQNVTFDAATGRLCWSIAEIEAKNPRAKAINQVVISIGAIIGCLVAPLIGGKIGRRPAYFLLCLGSLLVCAYLFRGLSEYDAQFILVAGLAGCATASFYGWLPLYLPELFPTRARATGQGLSFNFGRVLAAVGSITSGQLVAFFERLHPGEGYARSGATITLVYLVGMILIWFAPETKGKPLPD